MPESEHVPLDLSLATPAGDPIRLGEVLTERLTIVQLVRYFGCLPCQEWLVDLDRASAQLATDGMGAIAVGGSADYQARWLREEKGVGIPLLLDPDHRFREAVGAGKLLGLKLLNPKGAKAYAQSMRHGYRPQKITRDTVRSPGVVVLDQDGRVRWSHIGQRIGDYPPLPETVDVLRGLA